MRYSQIEITPVRGLTRDQARSYLGVAKWFDDAEAAGWLQPVQRGNQLRFDIDDVDAVWRRIKGGEWPQ